MTTQFDTLSNEGDATLDNTTGHWNNIMHKEERVGITVKKFIDLCEATFKDFDKDLLLSMVWNKGYKALQKFNTKTGRKELKKKAKFTSSTLKKPPRSGYIMFNSAKSVEYKKQNRKYEKSVVEKEWQTMTEEQKDVYRNKARKLNEEYRNDLQKEKDDAIEQGLYPADKPKRPVNEWILFRTEIYPEIAERYKPTEAELSILNDEELSAFKKDIQKKIQSDIKDRWENLTKKQKQKYINSKNKKQEQYLKDMEEWQNNEESRLMKIRNKEENSKQSISLSMKDNSNHSSNNENDTESSNDEDESVEVVTTTNTSVEKVVAEKVVSEEEVVEEVIEPEPEPEVKTDTKGKSKTKGKGKGKGKGKSTVTKEESVEKPTKSTSNPTSKTTTKKPVKKRVITVASDTDSTDSDSN